MSTNEARIQRERAIMRRLVRAGLQAGYAISVFDGEEWPVRLATDESDIMPWAHQVDELRLKFHRFEPNHTATAIGPVSVGTVLLIFGNDEDLISDYTATVELAALVDGVHADA